jgi:secreted trypsin-like serine protease
MHAWIGLPFQGKALKAEGLKMLKKAFVICGAAAWLSTGCGSSEIASEATAQSQQRVVRGTVVPSTGVPSITRPYVVLLQFTGGGKAAPSSFCSGTLIAPRVVLTAAHCIPNIYIARAYAYWGNDLASDISQQYSIPAPGQPSVWANVDSWQVHPDYLKNHFDADIAVVYLDRQPPFDPLPIYRNRLDSSWTNQMATLVGWGANKALSQDIQETEGFGVKRTGKAPIIGTPTLADYQPTADEVPLLTSTVRSHNVRLNGANPYANLCSGDSGGPVIINRYGQDYVGGVASRTGAWCENSSLYTRIDPYLSFLDEAYRRGGQASLVPSLDCVDIWNNKVTAYFGYKNDNGVSISLPYDTNKNYLPLDVYNERPTVFKPGNNRFQVGIDFTAGQTVYWKLSPPNNPVTEVRATSASPRCADGKGLKCAHACETTMAAACIADFHYNWQSCVSDCLFSYDSAAAQGCETPQANYLNCVASTPSAAANWTCGNAGRDPYPQTTLCQPQIDAIFQCLYPSNG